MTHPVVISIQVGKPQTFNAGHGEVWRSAFVKQPVNHPVFLGKTNLEGDGQADLTFHGGTDKAVLVHRSSRLKAHGFNRGMKGGVARYPLKRALRATFFVFGCCSIYKILIQLKPWDKHSEGPKRWYL